MAPVVLSIPKSGAGRHCTMQHSTVPPLKNIDLDCLILKKRTFNKMVTFSRLDHTFYIEMEFHMLKC
uniref:Uncharacterized protein n=1 Tax=Romanomermis culicivorax TaxID=13658 RepID=A0A915HYG2_ROMCU